MLSGYFINDFGVFYTLKNKIISSIFMLVFCGSVYSLQSDKHSLKNKNSSPELLDSKRQNCIWNKGASSNIRRFESQSAKVNGKLYVFSGFTKNLNLTAATEIYDPKTNQWTFGKSMPVAVTHMGLAVVENEVWIVGGFAGAHPGVATKRVQIYNTKTNKWREGVALPKARGSGASVYNNGMVHYFGGLKPDRKTDVGDHYAINVNKTDKGWKPLADLPNPRNHLSGAVVKDKIFAIGGQFGHDGKAYNQNYLHQYNPKKDKWTRKADLLTNRSHFEPGTLVHNDKIIIVGGRNNNRIFNAVTLYDPKTDNWQKLCELNKELVAPVAKVFNNKLYVSNGLAFNKDNERNPQNKLRWLNLNDFNVFNRKKIEKKFVESKTTITDLKIYPNAATTHFNIQTNNSSLKTVDVEVYAIDGRLIKTESNFNIKHKFYIGELSKGLFLVKLSSDLGNEKHINIKKLVVN